MKTKTDGPVTRVKKSSGIITGAPDIVTLPKNFRPEDVTIEDIRNLERDSFPFWALTSGAKVDGHNVDFDSHRYLYPIYADPSHEIVWQKAAQLGATVYMLLRALWWLKNHQNPPTKAGLYFPTKEGVENLSKDRLNTMLQSCPDIWDMIKKEADGSTGKLGLKKVGKSSFYLMHIGGSASKDSTPLDFVTFDEVRLCDPADISQALERISHSKYKVQIFMSTAGYPNLDINELYLEGTQHTWMSACGCPDGCDLPGVFPACVVDDPKRGLYLRCPKCKYIIKDPQNGRYVPMNPGANYNSYRASQLVSKFMPLETLWSGAPNSYLRTRNIKEFYNAKLGLPYVDIENQPVQQEHLDDAVSEDFEWAEPGECRRTAMGIDQGTGYLYITIADTEGNKKRIRHVEVVESDNPYYKVPGMKVNPFKRAAELMDEYNVHLCVCDAMPNGSDALEFAQEFPRRVFLAFYGNSGKEWVQWQDKAKTKDALRKAGPFLKFKYKVVIDKYLGMDLALNAWAMGDVMTPDPRALVQYMKSSKTGRFEPEHTLERMHSHLKKIVRQKTFTNEETQTFRMEWVHLDPEDHFAHAWLYCNVALERLRKRVLFSFA